MPQPFFLAALGTQGEWVRDAGHLCDNGVNQDLRSESGSHSPSSVSIRTSRAHVRPVQFELHATLLQCNNVQVSTSRY